MQLTLRPAIHEVFASVGGASLQEFRRQFQILHQNSPIRAVKLFLFYLHARGVDPISRSMAFYAASGTLYISVLLSTDPAHADSLSAEIVAQALPHLRELDPQFLFKFARSVAALKDPAAMLRALQLAPALTDYSILIPWLRTVSVHADSRIRARAAKILCQLRPNPGLIQRYLESKDGRVRAGALEALWSPGALRAQHEIAALLRSALGDPYHRVVANALVGLYRLGDTEMLQRMVALGSDKQYLFRAATAWAMGAVHDNRAIPALRQLTSDRYFLVRERASHSLLELAPTEPALYHGSNRLLSSGA